MKNPQFEVVCLLEADADEADELASEPLARLKGLGDSLVIAGGDGLFKVHIHCDDTDAAIAICGEIGQVVDSQVERLMPGQA